MQGAEGDNRTWQQETWAVSATYLAMKWTTGTHKGLWTIIVILSSSWLLTSGALLPKLRNSGRLWKREASQYIPPRDSDDLKVSLFPWNIRIPSITLRDWSLKWMSSDVSAPQEEDNKDDGQNRKSHLWDPEREEGASPGGQKVVLYPAGWVPGWGGKRSIVVGDDAAFREKSKMLTAMERQKWLNSYMQKFLVVNSD
ncbi:tuberoinfundibular peptide of 39 residues [Sceloporus undulatus]|uniref:tuberoinfundibular peptide of 39 residues n=1 Tax=Sceloporus undulatus TaxID=8520 RepID=UPI001C4BD913|nr:tuberoinfundibular peptide of 39 residues [Sceloporus undulatus]